MYNYSGVWYRIWGVCGVLFVLGLICLFVKKPHTNESSIHPKVYAIIMITLALCLSVIYVWQIIFTNVIAFSGVFLQKQRNSRVAPPLPLTYEYVFMDEERNRKTCYLDSLSERRIFHEQLQENEEYIIYYDSFTKVILRIERIN